MDTFHDIMNELAAPAVLYFIRHGESEGNVTGTMQGHQDHPLTELGREQARAGAGWFAKAGIVMDRVFASPLVRAFETAEILSRAAGFPGPEPLESAKELSTGVFTGLSFAEIKEQHPAEYNEFVVRSWEAVPNAERVHSLNRRALETWRHVVRSVNESPDAESGNEPIRIAVVTHGGMLQWIFKASFGAHPDSPHTWMPLVSASNCAVFEFTARPVHSRDRAGSPTRWYYGQWSRVNFTPAPESSAGSVAREQFHTDASDAR